MQVDVAFLPRDLAPTDLAGRSVAVFDVLRATTTVTAALSAGAAEVRVFASIDAARAAARDRRALPDASQPTLLCGEEKCLPPPGFDLGNSPGQFNPRDHGGAALLFSTTNGTRAILAARSADWVCAASLVNARSIARALRDGGRDVTLLCAGTGGEVALEDLIGAGAVIDRLLELGQSAPASDRALVALRLFQGARSDLRAALMQSRGGRNVLDAGLERDIDFTARLDALDLHGVVSFPLEGAPVIRRAPASVT